MILSSDPDRSSQTSPYMYLYPTYPEGVQGLIRFNDIFGTGSNQIHPGMTIKSASLRITRLPLDLVEHQDGTIDLHRMVADWLPTVTWTSALLNGNTQAGIQKDDVEALATATAVDSGPLFDVTADLQAWFSGAQNNGWVLFAHSNMHSWLFSSDSPYGVAERPILTIEVDPLPTVATGAASIVADTVARLNGTVNPNGRVTTALFEYGLTTTYGNTASVTLSPNNGTIAQVVSVNIIGLTPSTPYHFRFSATNSTGTVSGADQTFTTQLADTDGDGIPDIYETGTGIYVSPTDTGTSPTISDTDGDGLIDGQEVNTSQSSPVLKDTDGDGLTDGQEVNTYSSNPNLVDTDGDGLTDAWEVGLGRFSIIGGNFTWQQARTDAKSKGGDLACFPDEHRWNRAMETLGANALDDFIGLWLGASDAAVDGTWTWVNGEAFSFQQWGPARPSHTAGNTLDSAEVSGGGGSEIGKWYDRSPTTIRDGYILESGYATSPTVADADGDGLNDSQEQAAGSNPFLADTDGDGLTDLQEVNLTHTNPKLADSDNDGTGDAAEDLDVDGLSNLSEITQHGTDPLKDDTDSDGLSDRSELSHPASYFALVSGSFSYAQATADAATKRGRVASFTHSEDYSLMAIKARQTTQGYLWIGLSDATTENVWVWTDGSPATYAMWLNGQPNGRATENHVVIMENSTQWVDTTDTYLAAGYLFERVGLDPLNPDTDGDGLSDGQEINTTHSSPLLDDTDGDGLLDGAEVNTHGSSPLLADTDDDGLSDRVEVEVYHSNPSLKDSDGDGFDDAFEVNTGFNPALATSTPDAVSSIRTAVEFRFNAASGVNYRIEGSTDLNAWNTVETDIIGQSAVVTRFYSIENQPKRYFRVRRN